MVGFLRDLNFQDRFSKKISSIKFHQNPSSGSRVVSCGRRNGRTDMKLIVAFRNSVNARKNVSYQMPSHAS